MTSPRILAGRYRLDGALGSGTMGTVWAAHDEVLHRRVAIKQVSLPTGMPAAEAEQLADRTLREARSIAALSHPHVITLFDILALETGPAIVMELMVARSLAAILAESGPLADGDAAAVGLAVADGLTAAHTAGITHRDVKPANVLIADDGRIKLTDFGIARSVGEQTLTATGMLLGSPAYISPEVASGQPATPAADAWGLGGLLFAAVEGRPPYDGGDPIGTLSAVVSDPLPPHPHAGRLSEVIDRLLVKDPQLRLPLAGAREMLAAVAQGAVFLPPPASHPAPPASHPAPPAMPEPAAGSAPADAAPGGVAPPPVAHQPVAPSPVTAVPVPSMPARPVPPPPWAGRGAADLPALPASAPAARRSRWAIAAAIAVGLIAAAAGYFGVLAMAALG